MEREIRGERGGGVAFLGMDEWECDCKFWHALRRRGDGGGGGCATGGFGTPGGVETSRADVSTLRVRVMEYAFGVWGMWAADGQVGVWLWVGE